MALGSVDKLIYLPFNTKFILCLVTTLTLSFIASTYHMFFENFPNRVYILVITLVLLAIDVISGFIHKSNPLLANKRAHKPRPSLVVVVDIIMLILSAICTTNSASVKLLMVVNPLRVWKVVYCYITTSNIVGQSSMSALLFEFFIVSAICVHAFSCMWYRLMIYEEEKGISSWKMKVESSKIISDDIFDWYIVCAYYVTNTFTTIGFGDIVGVTDLEKILSLVIMVMGYIIVTGLFLAAFTTFLTLKYQYYADYKQRRSLVHKSFEQDYFPSKTTSDSIKLFYDRFWREEAGIYRSHLLEKIPTKMQEMVSYAIYKEALDACPLLEHLPIAVKKSLSHYVTKQIFLPGWKIIRKEAWMDAYLYISYGVAQVLTDEDDESSVFAIGLGSCICSSALVLSRPSKVHVNAATYCIIHELKRTHLFAVLKHYVGTNMLVLKKFQKLLQAIKKTRKIEETMVTTRRSGLKELKRNLDSLMKGINTSKEMVWFSEQESENRSKNYTKDLTDVCKKLMHMNYIPAVETEEITKDDACIRTEFPWVLEPNSQFLKFWGYLVVFTALLAALIIPYFAAFQRYIPQQAGLVLTFINVVYVLDLVFVCITAQEMPGGRVSKSKEVLKLKVKGVYFIIDVIGSVPLDALGIFFKVGFRKRMNPLVKLNQLIGMVKVHKFFTRMENGFEVNLLALRIIKYVLYFFITSYWLGSIYYSMACFNVECRSDSWYTYLMVSDVQTIPPQVKHKYSFEVSIYFGLLVITATAFGDISAHNIMEMIVVLAFCFVGTFLFCYLISDYSSTLTLQGSYEQAFVQFMNIMTRILENNKISNVLKYRIFNFMLLQWQHMQGYTVLHEEGILWDLPVRLKTDMKVEHIYRELKSVPLLDAMGEEFLNDLALRVEVYMIPPNEVMSYAGSVCHEFCLIEEGHCQMIDGRNKVIRIIHPQQCFNLFEMIVGLRSIHNVKTATHCRIVLITKEQIESIMNLHNIDSMREQLKVMVSELLMREDVIKIKIHRAVKMAEMVEEKTPSGFLFTAGHRAHPNIDYLEPFSQFGFLSGMRFILMPITINPNGPFMWWWEVYRGLCAFISSMIFPILPYIILFFPKLIWVAIFLDISAFVDLYLRLHTCYYNENGLLVLHPLSTAMHYFRTGFLIDFLAWVPVNYFLPFRPYSKRPGFNWINNPIDLIRCNRLLQMHRLISWCVYQEKQILKNTAFITFLKYFLFSIVFLNTLAFWLEILTVNFAYNPDTKEVDWQMLKNKHSWLYTYTPDFKLDSLENIFKMHLMAYYWTASVALTIGPGDITAQNGNEMVFVCGTVVLGFLYYNYVLVIIANAKASIDLNLTIYQERMQSLVKFMRDEDVSRDLQKLAIQHFERVWRRTRGVALKSMFTTFTRTLREDCLLQIYEKTFLSVRVFEGVRTAFFRELAVLVEELYYIKGETVVRQNDVTSSVLIVHSGFINVIDCVGVKIQELGPGSIFGNIIYKCPAIRSNVSFIADKNTDILRVPVKEFFLIARKRPKIIERLQNITYDGSTYFMGEKAFSSVERSSESGFKEDKGKDDDDESVFEVKEKKTVMYWLLLVSKIVHSSFVTTIDITLNLLSVLLCSYDLAFQDENLFGPIYTLEAIFLIMMSLRFLKSYEDPNTGETVTDIRKISTRYLREPTGFILDFIINFPIGLFLKYTVSHYAMTWANVIHLFRFIRVFKFIEVRSDRLNVKVVYIKVLVILITFTLLDHIFACFWNVVSCPKNQCSSKPCKNDYLCAFYYTVVTLTSTGYGDMGPRTKCEYLYVVLMIIGSRFIFAIFLGDITNAIQTNNYSFLKYEFQLEMLKKFLHVNGVNMCVHHAVINYCTRLWQGHSGKQIPVFYRQANSCLQQDLSMEIYGRYFTESFLFVSCHKDLLRQIVCCGKQSIHHPGDVISYENEVNDKMFIIHKGTVTSKSSNHNKPTLLKERDFFGVPQGLYHDIPHTRTYKAVSVCVILELNLNDWEYLLDFFPASKVELYDRAKRMEQLCEDVEENELDNVSMSPESSEFRLFG